MKLESSLLIIPPKSVQAFAYPLREEHDPRSFDRVPAHITLFYPFTPPEQADEVAAAIGKVCKKHPPFELTLNRYARTDDSISLEPDDATALLRLYQTLAQAYPEYVRRKDGAEVPYRPHLTLAHLTSPKDQVELPPAPSFTFTVERLHIYVGSREEETPYIPRATIPLGGAA
jgi:2'-5' RNA ligase